MSIGRRLFKPKPRIAESPPFNYLELKSKPYYIVASVEVGNTTTKSILTATDMNTGKTYVVNKVVKMTRDVRKPLAGEEIFARTINGTPLTKESIAELVRDTLIESHERARLDIRTDLHFVVRSTVLSLSWTHRIRWEHSFKPWLKAASWQACLPGS